MELTNPTRRLFDLHNQTMIRVGELPGPLGKGGRALNQKLDRLPPTRGLSELPYVRAGGTGLG